MSMTTESPPQSGTYLILLGDYLVAQDLAETVADYDPKAEVILRHTMKAAIDAVQPVGRIAVAFVGAGPAAFAGSPLAHLITERGGRVVLIGDDAENEGEAAGWEVLPRPFALQQVMIHLTGGRAR